MTAPERGYVDGWDFNSHLGFSGPSVMESWSSPVSHGSGHRNGRGDYESGSQNARRLYRTKLDALIGLRLELERSLAKVLADVDAQIEEERKANQS